MGTIKNTIGNILFWGGGFIMFIFYIGALWSWLGILGVILAILISPGVFIFPFVFWIVEGVFPTTYFVLWGISILGMIIKSFGGEENDY